MVFSRIQTLINSLSIETALNLVKSPSKLAYYASKDSSKLTLTRLFMPVVTLIVLSCCSNCKLKTRYTRITRMFFVLGKKTIRCEAKKPQDITVINFVVCVCFCFGFFYHVIGHSTMHIPEIILSVCSLISAMVVYM